MPVPHSDHATSAVAAPARLPARERAMLWAGLLAATAIAWIALAHASLPSSEMDGATMASMNVGAVRWPLREAGLVFAMWTVMMTAMMLPSATPMIEMHARIARSKDSGGLMLAWSLAAGYLMAWAAFSAAITAVQYALQRSHLIADAAQLGSVAGGFLLIATGIYQFTPLKQACLTQCRTPLGFLMTRWRAGVRGAIAMGLEQGVFCVGCCWLLMALMYVAGVMNLAWAAVLTIFVLLEKMAPRGVLIARIAGAAMVVSGIGIALFG